MDLDRLDYHGPRTDQISCEGAPYIMALGLRVFSKAAERWASIGRGGSIHRDIRNYAVR
jgi:hypothetical protein